MWGDWQLANFLHWGWHTRVCLEYFLQTGNTLPVGGVGGGVLRVGGFYGERAVWFYVLLCAAGYGGFYDDDPHLWRGAQA